MHTEDQPADVAVLTDTQAKIEASRCLMCDDPPCESACPAHVPVMQFIRAIRFDTPRRAINLIRDRNVLAGVCGLGCPVERLCVGACRSTDLTAPVAIHKLQHYAAMKELASGRKAAPGAKQGTRVAVVGAGPSGLAAAAELARLGLRPVVYERNPRAGGICTYGVPAHRMPQEMVAGEVDFVRSLGVEIVTSKTFGEDILLDALFDDGCAAVYLAVGAQQAIRLPLPGADLGGVLDWKQLLDRASASQLDGEEEPKVGKRVLIIGGGSVAMDAAGTAMRLGATDVDVLCLESPAEMPADREELDEARDAGVRFHTRSMPLGITGVGNRVTGLRAVRIQWKTPDRFTPDNAEQIPDTAYWLPADTVIFAVGARPTKGLAEALPGVDLDGAGRIQVDPDSRATSRPGVFAGGDVAVGSGATIVASIAEGRQAARSIAAYVKGGAA